MKIELGARSDDWPQQEKLIQSYLSEVFPQLAMGPNFQARVLAAERTFFERALLLHEETFRRQDKPRKICMARHYYNVWCLIMRVVAERTTQDRPLFDRVAAHREIFFRWSLVDYTTLHPGALRFVPPAHQLDAWRKKLLGNAWRNVLRRSARLRRNPSCRWRLRETLQPVATGVKIQNQPRQKVSSKSASRSASKHRLVRVKLSSEKSGGVILDLKRNSLIVNTSAMP